MAGDASRLNGLLLCCYKEMRLPLNSITGESLVRYCGIDIHIFLLECKGCGLCEILYDVIITTLFTY